MLNNTSKYFSFFSNKPAVSWVAHIARDFLTCYSCSYYSSMFAIIEIKYPFLGYSSIWNSSCIFFFSILPSRKTMNFETFEKRKRFPCFLTNVVTFFTLSLSKSDIQLPTSWHRSVSQKGNLLLVRLWFT